MNGSMKSVLALAALSTLGACGGSGGSRANGKLCPQNHNPIKIEDIKGATKVDLDPANGEIIQYPGEYQYMGAEAFYHNKETGVMIHTVQNPSKLKKGEFTKGIACAAGFSLQTDDFQKTEIAVDSMKVDADASVEPTFTVRDIVIGYKKNGIVKEFEPGDHSGFDSPKKVYDGNVTGYAFYKKKSKDDSVFEMRSTSTDGAVSVSVLVKYKRVLPRLRDED